MRFWLRQGTALMEYVTDIGALEAIYGEVGSEPQFLKSQRN